MPSDASRRLRAMLSHLAAGGDPVPAMPLQLSEPLSFLRGPTMPNRFMLAPLTNKQSGAVGTRPAAATVA